ncbi:DUF4434 domain-containing protein [bacterium]|nr:DUF4434 domain-containing protein [bacterium]
MITGTFLDEITHDIPAQNWGAREWDQDFLNMKTVGIDTVILIRAGYRNIITYDSKVLGKHLTSVIPSHIDLIDLFLTLSEKHDMKFFFGTYDSGEHWQKGDYQKEVDLNREITDEVFEKYGHRAAFKGWYISHEINTFNDGMMNVYEQLSSHLRSLKKVPILMSPYIKGVKQFGNDAVSIETHEKEWGKVFSSLKGLVDIVAFQDGQIDYKELSTYLKVNNDLAQKNGLTCWSNIESFDRDMPIKFPPIDITKLLYKMNRAKESGVDKMITFEFSHFMSPQSIYPAAHHLYDRYREYFENNL